VAAALAAAAREAEDLIDSGGEESEEEDEAGEPGEQGEGRGPGAHAGAFAAELARQQELLRARLPGVGAQQGPQGPAPARGGPQLTPAEQAGRAAMERLLNAAAAAAAAQHDPAAAEEAPPAAAPVVLAPGGAAGARRAAPTAPAPPPAPEVPAGVAAMAARPPRPLPELLAADDVWAMGRCARGVRVPRGHGRASRPGARHMG
jgi:hypothetical protein